MLSYKSLLTVLFFTFFIYANYFEFDIYFLNTLFAIMGLATLFMLTKKELFFSGAIISVLWFWWIGYSFVHYELSYLIPLVLLAVAVLYGMLFYLIGLNSNIFYKISAIFLLSFVNPFGFNWFKFELPFINSYLGTSKIEFLLILITIGLFLKYRKKYRKESIVIVFIIFTCLYIYNLLNTQNIKEPNLKIVQYQTSIKQENKWNKLYKKRIIENNLLSIKKAIETNNDLIILPETAFPLVLNYSESIHSKLIKLSYEISIVTGALYAKDGLYYNSTYFYDQGKVEVAHKVVLVPFGEAVPMPEKIKNLINDIFYNGAKDYETAKQPTTFSIKGEKFRNAICYEATTDEIYKDLDTSYVIVTSNNAWFTPSIQPNLQKLLLKYYKNKYNVHYFNVSNQ